MKKIFFLAIVLIMGTVQLWAHEFNLGDLVIDHPWARPSLGASPNGVAYMVVTNGGVLADRLLSISGDVAKYVEVHATFMDGDIMRMRPVPGGIEIHPGHSLEIVPGGLHVMLMGLTSPLKEGGKFPLNLHFERAGTLEVTVFVETKPGKHESPVRERHHE